MKLFFTADEHYGHSNILKYCFRKQFMNQYEIDVIENGSQEEIQKLKISDESVQKMNSKIISNHNERVGGGDTCIHNGDFCFKSANNRGNGLNVNAKYYQKQLNGENIYLVGNHDTKGRNTLKTKIQSLVLKIGGMFVKVVHKPIHADPCYPLNLVGHIHRSWKVTDFQSFYSKRKNELINPNLPQNYLNTVELFVNKWKLHKKQSLLINVGVDVWNFFPITWDEIQSVFSRWKNGVSINDLNKWK